MGQGLWSKFTALFSSAANAARDDEGSGDSRRPKADEKVRFAVYMPSSHEEALRPAEAMKSGSGVVINGEYLDGAGYQRLMDFLDGAAYVLGGSGRRVSDTVQVYVPATMSIVDEGTSFYGKLTSGKTRSDA
jgi:cell division inhibitor SepF